MTGALFVDVSAAYHTVNHRRLRCKVLEMTGDIHMTELIRTLLESRHFCGPEWEKEPMAATEKWTTTGKCTGTYAVQHLHQRSAHIPRNTQFHLCT